MKKSAQTFIAVEAIYAAAAAPEIWPRALDEIALCFNAIGTVMILQQTDGTVATMESPALSLAARDYEQGGWKLDFMVPRVIEISATSRFGCYTDRHLATPDEIASHPFYTQFRARHGLGPFLGGVFFVRDGRPVILTMQGRKGRRPFTDEEIKDYALLVRHVERSLQLSLRILEAEHREEILADALSRLDCGVILLDGTGHIEYMNPAADPMVGGEIAIVDRQLRLIGNVHTGFQRALSHVLSGEFHTGQPQPTGFLVRGPRIAQQLALYILPAIASEVGRKHQWLSNARVVVLIIDQPGGQPIDPAVVRSLFNLTPGEARLASLIGAGRTPREAAAALNITEGSARTILKRVFSKAGVSRQAELSAMLSRIPLKPPVA